MNLPAVRLRLPPDSHRSQISTVMNSVSFELPIINQPPRDPRWLIEQLLSEQQSLPAVERFSRWHEQQMQPGDGSAVLYESLIPLSLPGAGEQYAFQVDLDACSGCKACVTACHSLNGLDEHETWREVGLFVAEEPAIVQHVTTACHHCVDPACLSGCPVKAYDKDPVTGIVRHLDDQCIGCQYCSLTCPYDVPKYSPSKGIVRKCDMCRQRLSAGEAPACVQSCPNHAIRISTVSQAEAARTAAKLAFLPGSPDPRLTIPTTRFVSRRPLPTDVRSGEQHLHPSHGHLALVVMLVLTQFSVGLLAIERLLSLVGAESLAMQIAALGIGLVGTQAALLHLGRPLGAWRAWMGWRTSWLSREILVFGAYMGLLSASVAMGFLTAASFDSLPGVRGLLSWLALLVGIAGVCCSAMIYAVTGRPFWRLSQTGTKFALTTVVLGIAGAACFGWVEAALVLPLLVLLKLFVESEPLFLRVRDSAEGASYSGKLLLTPLRGAMDLRISVASLGGVCAPVILGAMMFSLPASGVPSAIVAGLIALPCLIGELLERYLFFAAVGHSKMPGALST